MSCYNWERGTIIIPSAAWAAFRKGMLETYNKGQESLLAKALEVYPKLAELEKRTWKNEWEKRQASEVILRGQWELNEVLYQYRDGESRLTRPTKESVGILPVTKDAQIHKGDFTVSFKNDTRSVYWTVSENNRAVEHAHEHWFAKALFAALNKIEWTRGSGGRIVGNDEYNRDSDYEGGGANYVTHDFHPKTQAEKKAQPLGRGYYSSYRSF